MDVVVLDHHRVDRSAGRSWRMSIPTGPAMTSGFDLSLRCRRDSFLFLVALNRHLRDGGFYGERGMAEPDLRAVSRSRRRLATICDVVPLTRR